MFWDVLAFKALPERGVQVRASLSGVIRLAREHMKKLIVAVVATAAAQLCVGLPAATALRQAPHVPLRSSTARIATAVVTAIVRRLLRLTDIRPTSASTDGLAVPPALPILRGLVAGRLVLPLPILATGT